MSMSLRWLVLCAVALTLSGCATEGPVDPVKTAGLAQKIESARSGVDHRELAAIYEQQAGADRESAARHRDLARAYERGWVWAGPKVGGVVSARRGNQSLIEHCENLERIYRQAAEENGALAKEHRRLAAEMND